MAVDRSISRRKASRFLETGKIMTQVLLSKSHSQKNILSNERKHFVIMSSSRSKKTWENNSYLLFMKIR